MKEIFKNAGFRLGLLFTGSLLLLTVAGLIRMPYDPNKMDFRNKLSPFSLQHLLGTDNFGRDIISRIMQGGKNAFLVGVFTVLAGLFIGFILGALSGYMGGITDRIIMKTVDILMAFPGILLALMMISVFGSGLGNTVLALAVMSVPRFTRITRAGFIKYRNYPFVEAARLRGAGPLRIIFLHILPNILNSLAVTCAMTFSGAVLGEAGLSYLGLGIQPPEASWGKMLSEGQSYIFTDPFYSILPGIFLTVLVLGFNLMADGIRISGNSEEQ